MVRTKVTVRKMPSKMGKLPAWMVNREYSRKKNLSFQDKTNLTSTKDSENHQEWTSFKNHHC